MTASNKEAPKRGEAASAVLGNPILLTSVSVLISFSAVSYYLSSLVPPRDAKETAAMAENRTLAAEYSDSLNTVRNLAVEREHAKTLEPKVAQLGKKIPPEPRLAEVMSDVRDYAQTSGVILGEGRPSVTRAQTASLQRLDLEIGASGSFTALYNLLASLDTSNRLYTYTSPSLKLNADRSLDTRFTVQSYYLKTQKVTLPPDPGNPDPKSLLTAR